MRQGTVLVLIVVALTIGAGIGYFENSVVFRTTTVTIIRTYPITTTIFGASGIALCVVTEYHVWAIEELVTNGSTIRTVSTQSYVVRTFQTSTSEPTVGFKATTTTFYAGTLTGAVAIWNSTTCTLISG